MRGGAGVTRALTSEILDGFGSPLSVVVWSCDRCGASGQENVVNPYATEVRLRQVHTWLNQSGTCETKED